MSKEQFVQLLLKADIETLARFRDLLDAAIDLKLRDMEALQNGWDEL